MTVHDLEVAKSIVAEDPDGVCAVYEYTHVISGERLWSVEHPTNRGATWASPYTTNVRIIYADGEWLDEAQDQCSST